MFERRTEMTSIVVAGPGSPLTVPGIIVSEITEALSDLAQVIRIEVDMNLDLTAGLHRAPSLAVAHDRRGGTAIISHSAPDNPRLRTEVFRRLIGPEVSIAVAYAWPGIDNSWIRRFIEIARMAGVKTVVACASLPQPSHARAASLAGILSMADKVVVGDSAQAKELTATFGDGSPEIAVNRALSLVGRAGHLEKQKITAFLPYDDAISLGTLLAAFDAIPEAWIDRYSLQVVMRYDDPTIEKLVKNSYHGGHVRLIGDNLPIGELEELCAASSALSIAEPGFDSRAFSMAVKCGIGTVVVGTAQLPEVGRGYVGGLLADGRRPTSVHVALIHALRLAELQFPNPDKWDELAGCILELIPSAQPESESKVGAS